MKQTVTIGIPAYNEEANIKNLIEELIKQKAESYELAAIVIASDGSTDNTTKIAKLYENEIIHIYDSKERLGLAATQNLILSQTKSDILILVNADISIKDLYFIEHMIKPIADGSADLVTPEFKQLFPATFFERILYRSTELKTAIYEEFKNGNNIYTCAGPARAFSKRLYKNLEFKNSANEDAYSYLYTTFNGYKYLHIHDTAVYFKLPNNFADHKKQSTRFLHSKRRLVDEFGEKVVAQNYKIPFNILYPMTKKYFIRYPLEISLYGAVYSYICIITLCRKGPSNFQTWQSSKSSKVLKS